MTQWLVTVVLFNLIQGVLIGLNECFSTDEHGNQQTIWAGLHHYFKNYKRDRERGRIFKETVERDCRLRLAAGFAAPPSPPSDETVQRDLAALMERLRVDDSLLEWPGPDQQSPNDFASSSAAEQARLAVRASGRRDKRSSSRAAE